MTVPICPETAHAIVERLEARIIRGLPSHDAPSAPQVEDLRDAAASPEPPD